MTSEKIGAKVLENALLIVGMKSVVTYPARGDSVSFHSPDKSVETFFIAVFTGPSCRLNAFSHALKLGEKAFFSSSPNPRTFFDSSSNFLDNPSAPAVVSSASGNALDPVDPDVVVPVDDASADKTFSSSIPIVAFFSSFAAVDASPIADAAEDALSATAPTPALALLVPKSALKNSPIFATPSDSLAIKFVSAGIATLTIGANARPIFSFRFSSCALNISSDELPPPDSWSPNFLDDCSMIANRRTCCCS